MGDKTMKTLIKSLIVIFALTQIVSSAKVFADDTSYAIDPSYVGVGARSLGMGKAYVAVGEDADTIFFNPAGLGRISLWKMMTMYSNLMGDVKYSVLSCAIPMEVGSFGFGYVSSRVDGIWIMGEDAVSQTHKPIPTMLGDYSNNVVFLSYGFPLNKIAGFGENIYLGANLKYFDSQGSGTDEAYFGAGKGIDADLGILYTPNSWLSLGISQQNVVPQSFGGAVTYKSGVEESMPSITKIGTSIKLLGEEDIALIEAPIKLNLSGDIDIFEMQNRSLGGHIGAEFIPNEHIYLRAGIDKDPVPSTVDPSEATNLTLGAGIKFAGVRFDYAYHPYSSIPDNATHFFSISYVGEEGKKEPKSQDYIKMLLPKDKFITRKDYLRISGIVRPEVENVEINGVSVPLEIVDGEKVFKIKVPLEGFGKKSFIAEAFDKDGNLLDRQKRRILRVASFKDVPEDYWAFDSIEIGATAGLFEGFPDGLFRPNQVMSRAELTTMMVRISKPDIKQTIERRVFPDLPYNHWALRYIEAAKDMGLVIGYPDKQFKADKRINRAEGVTIATRFDADYIVDPDEKPFADVSKEHWAAPYVETSKQKGLISYISSERFAPKEGLTRAEAAEIIAKTDYGSRMIEYILNWNKGFGVKSQIPIKSIE